jgi:modulator of FtsH protease HflK
VMPWNNGEPKGGGDNTGGPWGDPGGNAGGKPAAGSGNDGNRRPPQEPRPDPWGEPGRGGGEHSGPRRPNQGPFGGGFGGPSPDIDRLIGQGQDFIRGLFGGGGRRGPGGPGRGMSGAAPFVFGGLLVLLIWAGTGFYRVEPDEQGIVSRFGAYRYWTEPGLHWHIPWPIESVRRPAVTRINRIEIGYRTQIGADQIEAPRSSAERNVMAESLMLTGDENIIDIDFSVFWRIQNAPDYLFNTVNPEALVRAVAESSMREVIGRTPIQPALTQARGQIEADVRKQIQEIADRYRAGVEITQVQLQRVDPPAGVIESFRDVQRANTDAERMRNEAEAYSNDIVPRARGDAARIIAEAEGAKAASVAQATGQSQRFNSVLKAYQAAKDVTVQRLYLDTMQDVLSHAQSVVVDDKLKGLVPYLPLNLPPPPRQAPPPGPTAAGNLTPGSATAGNANGASSGTNSSGANPSGANPNGANQ